MFFKFKSVVNFPKVSFDCQGQQFTSLHCSGVRTTTTRKFCNFQNIFIFYVNLHCRAGHMILQDIPEVIHLNSKE